MENKQQNDMKNIISDTDLQKMTYRELSVLEGDVQILIERVREQKQKMSKVEIQRLTEVIRQSMEQIVELGGSREDVIQGLTCSVVEEQKETQPSNTDTETEISIVENSDIPTDEYSDEDEELPSLKDLLGEEYFPTKSSRTELPLMKDMLSGEGINQLIQVGNNDITEKNDNPQWGRIYSTDGLCPTLMHTGKTMVIRRDTGTQNPNKVRIGSPKITK